MNLNMFDDIDGLILRERENIVLTEEKSRKPADGTGEMSRFPAQTPLAMAYVPFQQWNDTHNPEDALRSGTLFPDLVFPFSKGGSR